MHIKIILNFVTTILYISQIFTYMPKGVNNRKSRAEKIRSGTYQPIRDKEMPVSSLSLKKIPDPPEHLSDKSKIVWASLCSDLICDEILVTTDLYQLEILLHTYDQYWAIQETLRNSQYNTLDSDEKKEWFSLMRTSKALADQIRGMGADFGLSPVSRKNLLSQKVDSVKIDDHIELIG